MDSTQALKNIQQAATKQYGDSWLTGLTHSYNRLYRPSDEPNYALTAERSRIGRLVQRGTGDFNAIVRLAKAIDVKLTLS